MKKRVLSLLLCIMLVVGMVPTTAFAGATDTWAVDLVVSKNTAVQYNGQDTVEIGFAVQSDNLKLKNAQSVVLAVDLEILDFLEFNGGVKQYDPAVGGLSTNAKALATGSTHGTFWDGTPQKWAVQVNCAKSSDGKTGYMQLLVTQGDAAVDVSSAQTIATVKIGFKSGKSISDLTSTSICFINAAECATLNQSAAIEITNGAGTIQQAIKRDGSADTLTGGFQVKWDGITPTEPPKPAYSGTIAAPTVKTNAGGKVVLNAVTPTGGPGGETVQYGYSTSASTAPTTWQDGTTFSGLHVGDTLYFYAKVEGTTEYQELVSAATSVTVLDKQLTNLEITAQPTTKTYTHGDPFKTDGMKVKATYSDGSINADFTGYTVAYQTSGKGYLCKDNTKVTLKAGDKSVEVTGLTVNAKKLTVTGLTAVDREYKLGYTLVNLNGGTLTGVVSGETVSLLSTPTTGRISNAGVGNGKDVAIDPLSLTGADAGNYTLTQPTGIKVNITRKNISGATITLGTQATYNGSEQSVVIDSVKVDGTALTSSDYTITSGDKATNVGDNTLVIEGKGNYKGTASAKWSLVAKNIGDTSVSITLKSASYDYTGSAITFTDYSVKDGSTVVDVKNYNAEFSNNTNAGTATLTITGKGNYTGTKSANFTIVAADQNPTFTTPVDLVTGGHRLNLTTLVDGAKGDMIFTITSGNAANLETGNTLVSTGTTGVVKIKVSIAAKDVNDDTINEYNAFSKSDAITVNVVATPAASVTAAPTAKTGLKYNGNDQALVSKGTANGGTMQYSLDNSTWSDAIPKGKDAKTYTVYYKVKGDSDHTDFTPTSNTVSVSIAQKEVTVAPGTYKVSKEYDSTTTAGTGNGTLSVTGIVDSGVSVTATPVAYTSANVGGQSNVEVNLTLSGTGSANYKLAASKISVPCSITPATLTVTPDANQSKKFKEADPALTYTYSGNASGQTPAFSGKLDREAGENVGTYAIKLGNLALTDSGAFKASNYTLKLSSPTVNFEIKKTDAPVPTGLKGVKGNELATVVLPTGWEWKASNTTMDNLGSHPFKAKYTDTTGNYNNATDVDVTVEVLAKTGVSSSITFPNGKLIYNGHGQEYKKATISGIIAGDTPSWTYTYAVDSSTTATLNSSGLPLTVGKYKVTAIYEDSANYGTATATLEITPAKPTGTPTFTKITEKGKTLNDAALTVGTLNPTGGTLEWVDGNATVVEANKAYEWKYTPADTDNYAPVTGTIVVYPVSTGIVIYSPCYTIKATAGANGTISPAGWCSVVENGSQTFTFTPDKGYTVAKVLVDGKSVGAVKSYTFKNVTKDHTIEVIFMKSNGNPATGVFVMP